MGIVRMKKMKLVGLSKEKEMILNTLNKCGCVELKESEEIENTHTRLNTKRINYTTTKLAKLNGAIEFINEQVAERVKYAKNGLVRYEAPKKPLFEARADIEYDEFLESTRYDYETMAEIDNLMQIGSEMAEARARITALKNTIVTLKSLEALDVPLDEIKDSKNTCMFIGTIPETFKDVVAKINEIELANAVMLNADSTTAQIFAICHNDEKDKLAEMLGECGFARTNVECDKLPVDEIKDAEDNIDILEKMLIKKNGDAVEFVRILDTVKLLYDFYSYKLEKIESQGTFRRTEKELAVVIEAWVPDIKVDSVKENVEKATPYAVMEFSDPTKSDIPPTLTNNNKVVKAFESVTNMYSTPSYREQDPNFSVMVFFFIFFGFMLSDAGYGLLLSIACFSLLKFVKLEQGMKSLVTVLAFCGISTIIWGVLFGGYFAIDISGTFLEKLVWFSPLEEPIAVLGLSLGIGVVNILYGMGMKASQLIKRGQWLDAICDVGSWYLLFLGIGIYAGSMLPGLAYLSQIGMYVSIAGVVALILTQGRAENNIFMKLFKGIGSLYGLVNYLSDILSYARLFGLGLATGVVGMVFNKIAIAFLDLGGPIFGSIIALLFIVVGHSMNIGLNLLGAYVHDCRLQYIEYFGKFYEGDGRIFMPIGERTKYFRLNR